MNRNNVLIMMPCYNEGDVINLICEKIHKLNSSYNILILDDGSNPSFKLKYKHLNTYLYTSKTNYGLGVTTNISINFMLENNYDFLVRVDGDNQHPIDYIPQLVEKLIYGSDFCIGTRVNANIGNGLRIMLSNFVKSYFNFMAKIFISKEIPNDLSSGFMAFNKKAALFLSTYKLERYPEPEIIMLLASKKFNISEIGIKQLPRLKGNSTISYFRAILLIYKFNIFIFNYFLNKILQKCKP